LERESSPGHSYLAKDHKVVKQKSEEFRSWKMSRRYSACLHRVNNQKTLQRIIRGLGVSTYQQELKAPSSAGRRQLHSTDNKEIDKADGLLFH
jgi:hypothetical protein